jgi:hypothetical protein
MDFNPALSDAQLKAMSKTPLRKILTIEFEAIYRTNEEYNFILNGEVFCSIPKQFFNEKQISLFESLKLEDFSYVPAHPDPFEI